MFGTGIVIRVLCLRHGIVPVWWVNWGGREGGRETRLVMRPLDGIPVLQIDYLPCTRKSSLFSWKSAV